MGVGGIGIVHLSLSIGGGRRSGSNFIPTRVIIRVFTARRVSQRAFGQYSEEG